MIYILLKAAYNLINVNLDHQGVVWYYAFSVLTIDFCACLFLSRMTSEVLSSKPAKAIGVILIVFFLGTHLNLITMIACQGPTLEYNFWRQRDTIKTILLQKTRDPKLLEFDDGIINYSLQLPTMHGIGFVLDKQGAEARREGRLLDYAYGKGFDIIASLAYVRLPKPEMPSAEIAALLKRSRLFANEPVEYFNYKILFIHPETGAVFIQFQPKSFVK
jgi:hypothetical protein